ncbi:hypothetical protein, partial [Burkholderia pseudomallei]|uniref:hypothetical protein n=1 Tax=Burkholderia pseudomallei TaxID=28450 RepID=UPI001C3C8492
RSPIADRRSPIAASLPSASLMPRSGAHHVSPCEGFPPAHTKLHNSPDSFRIFSTISVNVRNSSVVY